MTLDASEASLSARRRPLKSGISKVSKYSGETGVNNEFGRSALAGTGRSPTMKIELQELPSIGKTSPTVAERTPGRPERLSCISLRKRERSTPL